MRKILPVLMFALALVGVRWALVWARPDVPLPGFFPAEAAREGETEKAFRAMPTPEQARQAAVNHALAEVGRDFLLPEALPG